MKNLFVYFFVFCTIRVISQPAIQWQKTIGGNKNDNLTVIQNSFDSSYILGGISNSQISSDKTDSCRGNYDYWLVKLDSSGNLEWDKTIGGDKAEFLFSLTSTNDTGCILGGRTYSGISGDKTDTSRGATDCWILKLNSAGNIIWQKTIGGWGDDELNAIALTNDGGYILCCTSNSNISGEKTDNSKGGSDFWIIKLDSSGNVLWQKTIGGSSADFLTSVSKTTDGGFILGGSSRSNISGDKTEPNIGGSTDFWVVKIDSVGNIIWQNTVGGNDDDEITTLKETIGGGCILGGYSLSNISGDKTEICRGGADMWLVKLDYNGNLDWQKTIGGNNPDYSTSIDQTLNGDYIVGGYSSSNISGDKTENCRGRNDYWIIKIDFWGNVIWQKTIGGSEEDELLSLIVTADGSYIFGGFSVSDISGEKTENSHGLADYWILKSSIDTGIEGPVFPSLFEVYPNPFTSYLIIYVNSFYKSSIHIYNSLGELIMQLTTNEKRIPINFKEYPSGLYYITLSNEAANGVTKKIIKTSY